MHRLAAQRLDAGHEHPIHSGFLAQHADFLREPLVASLDVLLVPQVEPIDDGLQCDSCAGKAPGIGDDCRGLAVLLAAIRSLNEAKVVTPGTPVPPPEQPLLTTPSPLAGGAGVPSRRTPPSAG